MVCEDCEPAWPGVMAKRNAATAKAKLESAIKYHLKNEQFLAYGIAYWDNKGNIVNSMFNRITGVGLLGGKTGRPHRLGLIVLTEAKLWILELGDIVGEKIEAITFLDWSGHGQATSYVLKEIILQEDAAGENEFEFLKPFGMKATFTAFNVAGTEDAASSIRNAVSTANQI
jgi:hypothetical protein